MNEYIKEFGELNNNDDELNKDYIYNLNNLIYDIQSQENKDNTKSILDDTNLLKKK